MRRPRSAGDLQGEETAGPSSSGAAISQESMDSVSIFRSFLQGTGGRREAREHQVEAVHRLVHEIREKPPSRPVNYMLQHSTGLVVGFRRTQTGSGKSLTIACLVHWLRMSTYKQVSISTTETQDLGKRCFGAILILNDRKQLDRQLGTTVSDFLQATHMKRAGSSPQPEKAKLGHLVSYLMNMGPSIDATGGVQQVNTAEELHAALGDMPAPGQPARVLISTLQKFPPLRRRQVKTLNADKDVSESSDLAYCVEQHRICIVADEAHRSHGGGVTSQLHEALGGQSDQPTFITYIAFTATPDPKALKFFGSKRRIRAIDDVLDETTKPEAQAANTDGNGADQDQEIEAEATRMVTLYEPWHSYSMEDALRDGNVLNILQDYSTVCPSVQITNGPSESSAGSESKLAKPNNQNFGVDQLLTIATTHRSVVQSKAAYVAEHLHRKISELYKSGFKDARAMLVARSRQHVVWYCQEIRNCLQSIRQAGPIDPEGPGQLRVYAAFSGWVNTTVGSDSAEECDESVTEAGLNSGICDVNGARLLVVCNKYETGYDDPRLAIMYVDKGLQGAKAVQTLSRLNRPAAHLGKAKTCVIDFVNSAGSIAESFEAYFRVTQLRDGDTRHIEKRQRELQLDRVLSRILATLAFATAAKDSKQGLARALRASLAELVTFTQRLLPEFQTALVEDVVTYCTLCERLHREKSELPYPFAVMLRESLRSTAAHNVYEELTRNGKGDKLSTYDGEQHASESKDAEVGVEVLGLQETFSGEIVVGRWMRPLYSRRITRMSNVEDGERRGVSTSSLSLQDAIFMANAQLKDAYGRKALPGLRGISSRIEEAAWGQVTEDAKVPELSSNGQSTGQMRCDVGMVLAMLHRLEVWQFNADLLSASGVGTVINQLRKHPDERISSGASSLVKKWRRNVEEEIRAKEEKRRSKEAKAEAKALARRAQETFALNNSVREKAKTLLGDAIRGDGMVPDVEDLSIQACVAEIEQQLYLKHGKTTGKEYRGTLRSLAFNLRESWKVSSDVPVDQVLAVRVMRREVTPVMLVKMDQRELAPPSVRRAREELEAKQKRLEDEEKLKAELALKDAPACTQCGEKTVSLHTMTNGGTYAAERELIQKAECFTCGHKWRL